MPALPEFGVEELLAFVRGELPREREALINKTMRLSPSLRSQVAELRAFHEVQEGLSSTDTDELTYESESLARTPRPRIRRGLLFLCAFGIAAAMTSWVLLPSSEDSAILGPKTNAELVSGNGVQPKADGATVDVAIKEQEVGALPSPVPTPLPSDPSRPPHHVVLLIDASGSMRVPTKLPLVEQAFRSLLPDLFSGDALSMVVYAGASGVLLGSTPLENGRTIFAAFDALQSKTLQASIDANLSGPRMPVTGGFRLACSVVRDGPPSLAKSRIVLITDGDLQLGAQSNASLLAVIEAQAQEGVTLSVLGFADEAKHELMLRLIAEKGRGRYAFAQSESVIQAFLRDQFLVGVKD